MVQFIKNKNFTIILLFTFYLQMIVYFYFILYSQTC